MSILRAFPTPGFQPVLFKYRIVPHTFLTKCTYLTKGNLKHQSHYEELLKSQTFLKTKLKTIGQNFQKLKEMPILTGILKLPAPLPGLSQALSPGLPSSFASMLTTPLYPQLSHTNSLAQLLLKLSTPFSSKPIRTWASKINLSEDPEAKLLISYIPRTKAELQTTKIIFPK